MGQHGVGREIRQAFRGIKQILIPLPLTWSNESASAGARYALSVVYGVGTGEAALESR